MTTPTALFCNIQLHIPPYSSPGSISSSPSSPVLTYVPNPSFQPTRLVCHSSNKSLFSIANEIHIIDIDSHHTLNNSNLIDDIIDSGNIQRTRKFFIKSHHHTPLPHANTIQSLCRIQPHVYGCIDSKGLVSLITLRNEEDSLELTSEWGTSNSNYSVGWVGMTATADSDGNHLTSCHFLTRELIWSDIETSSVLRKCLLSGNPTSISSSKCPVSPSLVYCGDNNGGFGVWDVRQAEKNGCIHYELSNRSNNSIYSILQL